MSCRFGFSWLAQRLGRDAAHAPACREIRDAFEKSGSNRHLRPLSISFGAAVFQKGFTAAELMGRADEALYRAKQKRGSFCLYEEEKHSAE